jgi:hypothetical protein
LRISTKKIAMTSVAYAVTLVAVATIASTHLSVTNNAFAEEALAEGVATTTSTTVAADVQAVNKQSVESKEASTTTNVPVMKQNVRTVAQVLADYAGQKEPLTGVQLSELLSAVGFKGQAHKIAWGIAMRESNARPMALNNNAKTGDSSYGIFQINMIGDLGADRRAKFGLESNAQLNNPVVNAQVAYYMSSSGTDFGAWGIGPNAYKPGAGVSTLRSLDDYPGYIKVK